MKLKLLPWQMLLVLVLQVNSGFEHRCNIYCQLAMPLSCWLDFFLFFSFRPCLQAISFLKIFGKYGGWLRRLRLEWSEWIQDSSLPRFLLLGEWNNLVLELRDLSTALRNILKIKASLLEICRRNSWDIKLDMIWKYTVC